jgi:hypothetical protein
MTASPVSSSGRWLLYLALGAALIALAACDASPAGPEDSDAAELEITLEQMAAEANSAGDPDAAAAFTDGLNGVRFGVRPTEIAVQVGDEVVRYQALVVGVSVRHDGTRELVRRSLIAWTGQPRPSAMLHATSFSDEAEFSYPSDLATRADADGRARGTWADLVRHHRYVATSGPVTMVVQGTGELCPSVPASAEFNCATARWDVRLEGVFKPLPRRDSRVAGDGASLVIGASADGMNGVVLSRKQ